MEETKQNRSAQKNFGRLGWSLTAMEGVLQIITFFSMLIMVVGLLVAANGDPNAINLSTDYSLTHWLLFRLPVYAIGLPLAMLLLKKLPKNPVPVQQFSAKHILYYGMITFTLSTTVSLVSKFLMDVLARGASETALTSPFRVTFWYLLDSIILSPVLEELLFRKMLLDRFRRYGETLAILVSAVTFGLFHMELGQSLITTAMGMVFAYVYLRSGKIGYCMLLHSACNLFAAGIMQILMSRLSPKVWMALQGSKDITMRADDWMELLPLALYTLVVYSVVIAGWIVLIRNRKKTVILPAEEQLEPKQAVRAVFGSVGMVLFAVMSLVMIAGSIFSVMG